MPYVPWRNENNDLLLNFQTYQDRFESVKEIVDQNSKMYENHTEVLDEAVQNIESEEFASVAPNAQHRDEKDQEIG